MARDIIDLLLEDHAEIRRLFAAMEDTPTGQREELMERIVAQLAGHEAAEEALVHSTLRQEIPGGEAIAASVLEEESQAEQLLADMEHMDVGSPEFRSAFTRLEQDVLNHAAHEEREEFPRLRDHLDVQRRQDLGSAYDKLKAVGPTRPHPKTPQEPGVRAMAGPVVGMFDRARDAAREMMRE